MRSLKEETHETMSNESVEHAHEEEPGDEDWPREELLWRSNEVRKAAKDLRVNVAALPDDFPNRQKILLMVDEILALAPVLDPEGEELYELDRKELAEKGERWRQEFGRRPKTPGE